MPFATITTPTQGYLEPKPGLSPTYHSGWDSAVVEGWIRGLARRLSHSPIVRHLDRGDLEQELRVHLIRRSRYYSDTQGDHWSYFVTARLREAAASIIEFYRSQLRCPDRPFVQISVSNEGDAGDGNGTPGCPEIMDGSSSPLHSWELQHDVPNVVQTLKPNEQALCRCLMRLSITAAARELGLPRSTVMDAVRRLRGRFEDAGLRDFLPK